MKRGYCLIAAVLLAVAGALAFQSPHPLALVVAIFAPMLSLLMLAGAFAEKGADE